MKVWFCSSLSASGELLQGELEKQGNRKLEKKGQTIILRIDKL
ncbi:hypothetical protein CLOM621_06061 [Clostridium sp. M62/1]|nr:hypothetical protein CLOM621_06061 [Clostridium sp. M62/1]